MGLLPVPAVEPGCSSLTLPLAGSGTQGEVGARLVREGQGLRLEYQCLGIHLRWMIHLRYK